MLMKSLNSAPRKQFQRSKFPFMEEWKEFKLGEISTMKYGKLSPNKCGKYPVWSGYRYVGTSEVMNCPKGTLVVAAIDVGGTESK